MPHHYLISVDHERVRILVAVPPTPGDGSALHRVTSLPLASAIPAALKWERPRTERARLGDVAREAAQHISEFLRQDLEATWDFVSDFELYALVLTFVEAADKRRLRQAAVRSSLGSSGVGRMAASPQ